MTVLFDWVWLRRAAAAALIGAAAGLCGCATEHPQYAPSEDYQSSAPASASPSAAPPAATAQASPGSEPEGAEVSESSATEPTPPVNRPPPGSPEAETAAPVSAQPLAPLPPSEPAPPPAPAPEAAEEAPPPAPEYRPAPPVVRYAVNGPVVKLAGEHVAVVKDGETVNSISSSLMTPKEAVIKANRLRRPYELEIGRKLKIPTTKAYVVQPGDTLYGIGHRFSTPAAVLAEMNDFGVSERLKPGQKIALPQDSKDLGPTRITLAGPEAPAPRFARASAPPPVAEPPFRAPPSRTPEPSSPVQTARGGYAEPSGPVPYSETGPRQVQPPLKIYPGMLRPLPPSRYAPPPPTPEEIPPPVETAPVLSDDQIAAAGRGRFTWPVNGDILSPFGLKPGGQRNDGVDIAAVEGTPVHAAAAGEVVYAGDQIPGFGNLVLIKHDGGWVTAYAHMAKSEVKIRQHVDQGDEIGQVGDTGGVTQPQLHFEIRYAATPRDKARPVDPNLLLGAQPAP